MDSGIEGTGLIGGVDADSQDDDVNTGFVLLTLKLGAPPLAFFNTWLLLVLLGPLL
jgi:hypothetical protein